MIENFLSDWIIDAIVDSVKTVPFLFFVFLFIELFEHFFADKIRSFLRHSKKEGPILGGAAASIPQCGFSVIASTLYTEGFITRGTIIAVYLATSDEALPVLLMYPEYFKYIFPLILIKLLVAIPVGYLVDLVIKKQNEQKNTHEEKIHISGCHSHEIAAHRKRDFLIHPIKHTLSIFVFILVLTLLLNYLIEVIDITNIFKTNFSHLAFLTPLVAAIFGLIPNCAVSVGLVLMFIKGTISFGAMISGLMTSSGLGLLILFKNNKNRKDIALILSVLVLTGYITGIILQTVMN